MASVKNSNIEWTGITVNFWKGCKRKSPECDNCYMYRWYNQFGQGDPAAVTRTGSAVWNKAKKAQKEVSAGKRTGNGRLVFTCSLSDFFNPEADKWRDDAWQVIRETPGLVWQILTKLPNRIKPHVPPFWDEIKDRVWLGTSCGHPESLFRLDYLMDATLKLSPAVTFVSAEPLIAPVIIHDDHLQEIDWLIVGGESGYKLTRPVAPMHPSWALNLMRTAKSQGVKVFFKQWGDFARAQSWGSQNDNVAIAKFNGRPYKGDKVVLIDRYGNREYNPSPSALKHKRADQCVMVQAGKKIAGRKMPDSYVWAGETWDDIPPLPDYEPSP